MRIHVASNHGALPRTLPLILFAPVIDLFYALDYLATSGSAAAEG
jgi:hypothetical protein